MEDPKVRSGVIPPFVNTDVALRNGGHLNPVLNGSDHFTLKRRGKPSGRSISK